LGPVAPDRVENSVAIGNGPREVTSVVIDDLIRLERSREGLSFLVIISARTAAIILLSQIRAPLGEQALSQ
jgi:hypothetical protein